MHYTLIISCLLTVLLYSPLSAQNAAKLAAGPALFGTGDVSGAMAFIENEHFVKKYFSVAPRLSFAYGSHMEHFYYLAKKWDHLIFAFDYDLKLYLLKSNRFIGKVSFAPSVRFLNENSPGTSFSSIGDNGEIIAGVEKYHYRGNNFGATVGFGVGMNFENFSIGFQAASSMYNKGTTVLFIGPMFEFRY